jgi:hypothetical protein
MKKTAGTLAILCVTALIGALVLSPALTGCDLFNNKPEIDVEQVMDEAIAYANAAQLTVEVYYPESWGRSPQFGPLSSDSARQGFPFTVEFTVSAAYGFSAWRAYRTGDLGNKGEAALKGASPLTAAEAAISGGTDGRASVTVNITDPVTLIPWCEDRPRITQANPPLINSGISYARGQQVKIWFAAPLDPATVKFGEGFIEITGQTIGESSEPYDDPDTAGVHENGDLTGRAAGTSRFFKYPEYDTGSKTITIRPGDNGEDGTKLPPENLVITVTIGVNVHSSNGSGMASPVSFYYRTNTLEVKNVYTAENIWAIHEPLVSPSAEKFFYSGATVDRDRRLRKNASGRYEVTLYFTVQASNPTEMTDPPATFKIAELHYANLGGDAAMSLTKEGNRAVEDAETVTGTAGAIYRQLNGGAAAYYKIRYEWTSVPQPGIIRLIVLPYRDTGAEGDIAPDSWGNAHAEGRFAAVVLDNQPPSGNAGLSLSGAASVNGGVYNYSNTTQNKNLNITTNFSNVADNGGYGIPKMAASLDKPWTMDDPAALQWQWRIVTGGAQNWPDTDTWYTFSETSKSLDLSTVPGLDADTQRNIQVRFTDVLGNTTDWITMGTIVYYTPAYLPVTVWSADYSNTANTVTVYWTTPSIMDGVELSVNGGGAQHIIGTGAQTRTISGVPKINASGVLSGQGVTSVTGYTVTLTAYNTYGRAAPATVKIWNIPGMSVSNSAPAIEISDNENDNDDSDGTISLKNMAAGSANKKYVLVNDIDLTGSWTPKGTSASAFTGTFYGNGHTIKIGNITAAADMGLFGVVSGGTVRDLTVEYAGSVNGSGETRFGGIAGTASGAARFENVTVQGAFTYTQGNDAAFYAGGIAGLMQGTAVVSAAYSSLDLTVDKTTGAAGSVYVGGVAGSMGRPANGDAVTVEKAAVTGDITVGKTGPVSAPGTADTTTGLFVGGLTGFIRGTGNTDPTRAKLLESDYRQGNISVTNGTGVFKSGGAVGLANGNVKITGCSSRAGSFSTEKAGNDNKDYYAGGFLGQFYGAGDISGCYSDNSMVTNTSNSGFTGAVVGGGFAGMIGSGETVVVTYCYALGNVSVTGSTSSVYAGGFAGRFFPSASASYCYAAGNVKAYQGNIWAGGFAGDCGSLDNCYALGDVFADNRGAGVNPLQIGGLAGEVESNSTVEGCFAAGSVFAQDPRSPGASVAIYAGGLVGQLYHSTTLLQNSVALGASVTATGPGTVKDLGRVYGRKHTSAAPANNHAYNDMKFYQSGIYGAGGITPTTPTSTDATGADGKDAHPGITHNPAFWSGTAVANGSGGLGFSPTHWIFTRVSLDDHPILRSSPNGPAMGGQ